MDGGAEERMTKKLCSSGKMRQKEKYKDFDKNEKTEIYVQSHHSYDLS